MFPQEWLVSQKPCMCVSACSTTVEWAGPEPPQQSAATDTQHLHVQQVTLSHTSTKDSQLSRWLAVWIKDHGSHLQRLEHRSVRPSDSVFSEVTAAFMASPVSHQQMVVVINTKKLLHFFFSFYRRNLFVLRKEACDLEAFGLCETWKRVL